MSIHDEFAAVVPGHLKHGAAFALLDTMDRPVEFFEHQDEANDRLDYLTDGCEKNRDCSRPGCGCQRRIAEWKGEWVEV